MLSMVRSQVLIVLLRGASLMFFLSGDLTQPAASEIAASMSVNFVSFLFIQNPLQLHGKRTTIGRNIYFMYGKIE